MKVLDVLEKSAVVFIIVSFGGSVLPVLLTGGADPADPDAPGAALWFELVYVLILAMIALRPRLALRIPAASPAVSLVLVMAFLSALWSIYPDVTLRRSIALLFTTLFAVHVALRYRFPEIVRLLAVGLTIMMFLSFAFVFAMPEIGLDHAQHVGAWKGIFFQKNVTGRMMVWLALCLLWLDWTHEGKRWLVRPLLALCLLLIVMSRSGTALVTVMLMAVLLLSSGLVRGNVRRFVPGMAFIALVGVLALTSGASLWSDLLYMLGRDPTLTGRTVLWKHTLMSIHDRLILGWGYAAYWYGAYGPGSAFTTDWGIDSAHNGWIDAWLDLGIPGVALVAALLLRAIGHGFLATRYGEHRAEAAWIFTIGCILLVTSISESVFLERHSLNWVVLVIGVTRLVQHRRRERWEARLRNQPPPVLSGPIQSVDAPAMSSYSAHYGTTHYGGASPVGWTGPGSTS